MTGLFTGRRWAGATAGIGLALIFVLGLGHGLRAADWDAGGGDRWQTLLARARGEGTVVISGCRAIEPLVAAFKRDTGIDVTLLSGQLPDLENRFRLETQTGRVTIDVRFGGPAELDIARAGKLLDLNQAMVLPDLTDLSHWRNGRLEFLDNTKRYLMPSSKYVSTPPYINTAFLDPIKIQSLADLLKPEFKGKIAMSDPTVAGVGQTIAAYIASIKGVDFVKSLVTNQDVVFSRDNRQLAEWLARGVYPIVLGTAVDEIERFRGEGITTLKAMSFSDGPGSLSSICAAELPTSAPHPSAAIVFFNWFFSRVGQEAYVRASRVPSLRSDVSTEGVPAEVLPRPGAAYVDQFAEDWYTQVRPGVQAALRKALDK